MAVQAESRTTAQPGHRPSSIVGRAWAYVRSSATTSPAARRQLVAEWVWVVVIPAALLALWFVEPPPTLVGTHEKLGLPPCTMRTLLGIPCPGCGTTTGIALILHGRIGLAVVASLLAVPVFLGAVGLWLQSLYSVATSRRVLWLRGPDAARAAVYTLLFLLIAWAYKIVMYFHLLDNARGGAWGT